MTELMAIPWASILFQLLLTAGGIVLFAVGALSNKRRQSLLCVLALIWVLAAGAAALLLDGGREAFLQMLDVTGYARFFNVLIAIVTALTVLLAHRHVGMRQVAGDEFYGLVLYAALGMSLVAGATHWLVFFLGFELLSLSFYVLVAVRKQDFYGNEAGLKFLVMGMVAGGFLAFGIAVLYAATGTLNMAQSLVVAAKSERSSGALLAMGLIWVAIGFKLSLVPFHLWTPDVYQGAPAPVTAFLSTGSKIAVFAGLLRLLELAPDRLWGYCIPVLWGLAATTMVVGDVTALAQTRLKRLLAYSSIAQMGYVVMGLLTVRTEGGAAVVFYFAVYVLAELGAFGVIATLTGEHGDDLDDLDHYRGLGYSHPWQAFLLSRLPVVACRPAAYRRFYQQVSGVRSGLGGQLCVAGYPGHPHSDCFDLYLFEGVGSVIHAAVRTSRRKQRLWIGFPLRAWLGSSRHPVAWSTSFPVTQPYLADSPGVSHHELRCSF